MKKFLMFLILLLSSSLTFSQEGTFKSVIQNGSTSSDYVYDLYVDTLGNKYITGKFKGTIDFGNGVTITPDDNYDGYVAKYDSDNNILWAKSFGGYSADEGDAISVDQNGNVLVAGVFFDTVLDESGDTLKSYGNFDIILLKYDANGTLLWAKQGYTENQDKPTDILVDNDGNYLLLGYFDINDSLTLPFKYESLEVNGHGERDACVIKMDSDGSPIWGITAGGVDNLYPGKGVIDNGNNLYFTGYYYDTTATFGTIELPVADGSDVFATKVTSLGNFEWAVALTGSGYDKGTDVDYIYGEEDGEGVLLVTGYFEDSLTVLNGDPLTFASAGDDDIFVLGLHASTGNCDGGLSYGGIGEDQAKSIVNIPGSDGTFYVTGNTKSDLPLPDSTVLTNYGGRDMFVLHFSGPTLDWGKNFGGSSYDYMNETVVDNKGNIFFGGNFKSSPAAFDPFQLNSFGSYDLWIGEMKEENIGVHFLVNMSVQISKGLFNPLTDSVFVRGSFQVDAGDNADWQGNMFKMEPSDIEGMYEVVVSIPADSAGKSYEYKFATNNAWETIDNRTFTLLFPTTWVGGDYFNYDNGSTSPTQNITFEVDMNVQADNGNFNPATDTVSIAGTMNGWTPLASIMNDDNADGVYSISFDLEEGKSCEYKFVINGAGWESIPNRQYTVPSFADTVSAFYDNDSGAVRTEIAISFECNMELEIAAARFNPATDTLSARGSFNGWSDATMMVPSATDPNVYEAVALYNAAAGEEIYYKFAYTTANGTNWETGDNYLYTVTSEDITNGYAVVPLRGYNNSTLETVVNQESVIRFVVDMNGAVDGNGVAFPSIDNVVIAGANPPLAWPAGGWPDADSSLVIFMVDDGTNGDDIAGDNIWTMEVTFPIYSPLDIEYKYGANWGLSTNGGANDNEGGVGSNHHIILFPEFTYGSAYDTFGNMETKDVETSVEKTNEIPTVYELNQNYPNPFNPSTVIKFSIPESGFVSLKVFNILGQEVANLLNESKEAGVYEVSFDASSLTTGMYIYRIQSGNFTATKKMVLIK